MKLSLVCVGRLSIGFLREGVADYEARLKRYAPLRVLELKEEKGGKNDPTFIRRQEGRRILEKIPEGAFVIALDERGSSLSSEDLAGMLERHMLQGTPELMLVIGGAYGLCDAVRQRADLVLSLSAMTLTHQMARLLLMEQLYRGFTIVRNEPYHNR
ncbi:MAG: 23S rRNA (pseudouridine(1915)-N(3))-methyltransferase RlmH [Syntrophotalea acetylenica]|uniref:Ribosomal RNA large subunit methyltransferase H n=1 Tax=Syntrophotalea acetylenica TaxID=29542 RepID=A0A1L3GGG4_SYNAC|nr:23S rRNA (pseudouridine(1915)-N(3))-methyltransferase RlmH [Syntrophotalea acetylenica]APG25053.1 50S rRNA methyltransferase [Syntrophotalea acetylenica]APG43124.1 50S rRNA methyltransferase [Syntrophotalea acetylenica]MDD4457453.1 23S rRNA (pseudouridine(1915)-N(3))-methyltransferase RlmH [Syntrophotalea acetylenica]MDY0260953.1 23S rRNA (pseudouridine(1915)-N(3))-methyltransferase RlmH [Syntrophotalea acetylenica]